MATKKKKEVYIVVSSDYHELMTDYPLSLKEAKEEAELLGGGIVAQIVPVLQVSHSVKFEEIK